MLHKTKAYILRTIKYGETSIITTLYSEALGMQTYMVNGARSNRKSGIKANLFEPGQALNIVAHHNPLKNMQRIREARPCIHEQHGSQQFIRRSIIQFCTEVILRSIREEESNANLFAFIDQSMQQVNTLDSSFLANYPIHFLLAFVREIGFEINHNYSTENQIFNYVEGEFKAEGLSRTLGTSKSTSKHIEEFYSSKDFREIKLIQAERKEVIEVLLSYLKYHLNYMGEIKSLAILHEVLA